MIAFKKTIQLKESQESLQRTSSGLEKDISKILEDMADITAVMNKGIA